MRVLLEMEGQYGKRLKLAEKKNEEIDMWGEELSPDAVEKIEEIEALSQRNFSQTVSTMVNHASSRVFSSTSVTMDFSTSNVGVKKLVEKLQEKEGEATHLRRELEDVRKKYLIQDEKRNNEIEDLKKQLFAKQTELTFQQRHATLLQEKMKCINAKTNSSFSERSNNISKRSASCTKVKDKEVSLRCHEGELFYDSVMVALYDILKIGKQEILTTSNDAVTKETLFSRFGAEFMKLVRCKSFTDKSARNIIRQIIFKCTKVLLDFYANTEKKENKLEKNVVWKNSNLMQDNLNWNMDMSVEEFLLSNKPWYSEEISVKLRQTITTLSILICIDPTVIDLLLQQEPLSSTNADKEPNEQNVHILSLLLQIINLLDKQNVIGQHLGFLSAVIYFYRTLCCCCKSHINNKTHEKSISDSLLRIILSSQHAVVVKFVIKFLCSSTKLVNITQHLCHRSDADSFVEDNISYTFSEDTCALQVLCVGIEMMPTYEPDFIFELLSWSAAFTSMDGSDSWLYNKTDANLCECLPYFEQTLIKVMNSCILQYKKSSSNQKNLLGNSLRLIRSIFVRLKHHDVDFEIHIIPCQGQYINLLHDLKTLFVDDKDIVEFTTDELERLSFNDIPQHGRHDGTISKAPNADCILTLERIKEAVGTFELNECSLLSYISDEDDTPPPPNEPQSREQCTDANEENLSVRDFLQSTFSQMYFN